MNLSKCLSEEKLWAILDESASVNAPLHVKNCCRCRDRLKELRSSYEEVIQNLSTLDLEEFLLEDASEKTRRTNAREDADQSLENSISRYQIIRSLSYGGQGQVYLAEDSQLNRKVAIKIAHYSISEDIVSSELILAEGEMLAKLNHPQLAQVYDAGIENGRPFLVMEYVEGQSLKDYLHEKHLSVREIRRIILEIARAVEVIHECGILHLDLKPENVIVTPDGRCKVVDLGASWLVSQTGDEERKVIGGTIAYMSPEQFFKEDRKIGSWTDVFGLGAVLYSLLTHASSEIENNDRLNSKGLWIRGPIRLSEGCYQKLLSKICLKAIKEKGEDRFQSVSEFIESLEIPERRRQAAYLIGTGVLSLVVGLFQVFQFVPSTRIEAEKDQHIVVARTRIPLNEVINNATYLQIQAVNSPTGPMHFCFWSNEHGLRFLPATRDLNDDGVEVLKPRSNHNGLKVLNSTPRIVILIIAAEFAGPYGTPEIIKDFTAQLSQLSNQLQKDTNQKVILYYSENHIIHKVDLAKHKKIRNFELYEFNLATESFQPT